MSFKWFLGRSNLGMRPVPFLGSFLIVGLMFALQQWLGARIWYQKVPFNLVPLIGAWEFQYLLWGIFCWILWNWLGDRLQKAGWKYILIRIVPLSILMSVVVEMALTACFPQFPVRRYPMSFLQRLNFALTEEFLENTAVFWGAFIVIRAIGYYRESRQRERDMSQLAVELTEARMMALRMQINPHFLFNTMNSISSLMRSDVEYADNMLEQLSCLLRMSLERGESQLITLREEIEFIELYLAMQERRYSGRVKQSIRVEPELHDASVPTMLPQPVVENAYVHGLSRTESAGTLVLEVCRRGHQMRITVMNSGIGLNPASDEYLNGHGVGLRNIKSRLKLHYGEESLFEIAQVDPRHVQVNIILPIQYSPDVIKPAVRFGTQ